MFLASLRRQSHHYQMYCYTAYGLSIRSELLLPELPEGGDGGDLSIHLGRLAQPPSGYTALEYSERLDDGGIMLSWRGIGTFLVRDGREVIANLHPDAEESRIRLFLLGAVMGIVLHQRGLAVFHATAVTISRQTAAFLGGRGWGKSTMAAALHQRGHRAMTDDVTALELIDAGGEGNISPQSPSALVYPAFPQLKLWPDAVTYFEGRPDALPRLTAGFDKRARPIPEGFNCEVSPLSRIYLLGVGASLEIVPLKPSEAMLGLVRHHYTRRFHPDLTRGHETDVFTQCAWIARSVPAFLLIRPPDLGLLPAVARLVEEHIASEAVLV